MATTLAEAFRQLKTNLEVNSVQESATSTRQQNVRNAVAKDFVVLETFLTEAYRRNTMIAPLKSLEDWGLGRAQFVTGELASAPK